MAPAIGTGAGHEREERLDAAARRLVESRLAGTRLPALDPWCRPADEDEAYAVQRLVHARLTSSGRGERVGRKIGCTTKVMQQFLGIPNPCAGGVFGPAVTRLKGNYDASDFRRVGVECEIAVRLGADLLPDAAGKVSRASAAAAIGSCMAAIEVVEDRYLDYPSLDTPTLIADDFFNAGCVLGDERGDFPPAELDTVTARMEINGVEVGRGVGTDVLGHPLEPLCWLAAASAGWGEPLRAGEFVLLGSLVQTHWIERGDSVRIVNRPFGAVTMHLK